DLDLDARCTVDYMVVGQHDAIGREDHARAGGRAALERRVDVDHSGIDLRCNRGNVEAATASRAQRRLVSPLSRGERGRREQGSTAEQDADGERTTVPAARPAAPFIRARAST